MIHPFIEGYMNKEAGPITGIKKILKNIVEYPEKSRQRQQDEKAWQKKVLEERRETLEPFLPKLEEPDNDMAIPQFWMDDDLLKKVLPPDKFEYRQFPPGGKRGVTLVRRKDIGHKGGYTTTHMPINAPGLKKWVQENYDY